MTIYQFAKSPQLKFRKRIYTGTCFRKTCGNIFFTLHAQQKHCREGCSSFQGFESGICTRCKKSFTRRIGRSKRSIRQFCSLRCYWKFNNGLNHSGYKGKKFMDEHGYKVLHIKGRTIKEHRHFFEKLLRRKLKPFENVHHKNGIRNDNRPSNLELWTTSQPSGQRVKDLIKFVIKHYKSELLYHLRLRRMTK